MGKDKQMQISLFCCQRKRATEVVVGARSRVVHVQVEGSIVRPIVPVTGASANPL